MGRLLPSEHGTMRGFNQHKYHSEKPCRPCQEVCNVYQRRLRARRMRCTPGLGWPLEPTREAA